MIPLNVPYHSQWADDANIKDADCGPTCLTMMLNFKGISMTPDRLYEIIVYKANRPEDEANVAKWKASGVTSFFQLMQAAKQNNLQMTYQNYENRDKAFSNLQANLDAGNPGMALVTYQPWATVLGNTFTGGHFVVVTGYDDDHIFMHDPLFGNSVKPAEKGAHVAMPRDLFNAGWSATSSADPLKDFGINYSIAYIGQVVQGGAVPTPPQPPQPQVPQPPTPNPITPPQPIPQQGVKTMDDVERRIRALAAWRWAEPPNFGNPEATRVWTDNLGDFGLEYVEYRVQSGDSLSALSVRNYGEANRWPAIKSYNDLKRETLNLGELIFIPQTGTSGAQRNPALPHDTIDTPKGLDDLLFDPDLPPFDYDAVISPLSVGMGFAG